MDELQTRAYERRRFLVRLMLAVQAAIGAILTYVLGGSLLAPAFTRRDSGWLRAAALGAVRDDEPLAVTLRVARQDGYTQIVHRTVVYLIRSEGEVRAMRATCTHLGCPTRYDREHRRIVCPCHGGVYDIRGGVLEGPPPAPLPRIDTRIEGDQVLVRI